MVEVMRLLTVLAALALLTPAPVDAAPRAAAPATDVIVHLFQWPWASVASECDFLGSKGFRGVQVSPPAEHVVVGGHPWWQDYQPVSYGLTSRRGDRAAFASMVSTCHAAGVEIYVDAVVNHMAGGASGGPGSGGSTFSHYAYPAVPYGDGDFHHCGRNGNDDIVNWGDRWEVQNCELVDLSDLRTESPYVRSRLDAYLRDLISLGVDGFRVDAAKHVPAADMAALFDPLPGYVFQEVIEGGPGEISPTEYTGIGQVTEFRYGDVVSAAFRDGNLPRAAAVADSMLLASDDAVVFVDNHDTQRNGRPVLSYKDGATYALAQAFMLTWPYGHAQVMSSFSFSSLDQGPPSSGGTTTPVACGNGWECEHRWRSTANLVGFRNEVWGTGVTDYWTNGSTQLAYGRGDRGYVVFNRTGSSLTRTFETSLPAGTYCDVTAEGCRSYTVNSDGTFTATIGPNGVFALHTGARP